VISTCFDHRSTEDDTSGGHDAAQRPQLPDPEDERRQGTRVALAPPDTSSRIRWVGPVSHPYMYGARNTMKKYFDIGLREYL
jgi:hypothetical protein